MRKNIKILSIFIILLIIAIPRSAFMEGGKSSITILFTHDLHDHYYPFQVEEEGEIKTLGGYARLYSVIKSEREKDPELLLVDAGDYSMGTLFQTIFSTDSPALRIMGKMGYDATTFGNHEFDFRAEGLAESLMAAKKSKDPLPQIVASNIFFPEGEDGSLSTDLEKLKEAMMEYGVKDYTVIERKGIKIGVFGLMGKEADSNAPMAGVEFTDQIQAAKDMVSILKDEEKVDLIICLSHSGTKVDKSKSEDEILAKEVADIDIIISGHTHTTLDEPIIVGNTIIASAGQYGEKLGVLRVSKGQENRWQLEDYRLEPITHSIPMDEAISEEIEYYKSLVQEKYLSRFNLAFDEVLAYTPFNFTPLGQLGRSMGRILWEI